MTVLQIFPEFMLHSMCSQHEVTKLCCHFVTCTSGLLPLHIRGS